MDTKSEIAAEPILKVENLAIGYKDGNQISNISSNLNFSLNDGELIGLVGANGIGKSTLLRTISGLQEPLKGNLYLNGKEFKNMKN